MTIKIPSRVEQPIDNPDRAASVFRAILRAECPVDQDKEHFWVMGMTAAAKIKYIELVSLGTLKAALVAPREAFRFAIMQAVYSIITCHNHPSGDPAPSDEDLAVTNRLIQSGQILGIELLDHVIIAGENNATSIKEITPHLSWTDTQSLENEKFSKTRRATIFEISSPVKRTEDKGMVRYPGGPCLPKGLHNANNELSGRIVGVKDHLYGFKMTGLWDKKPSDAGDFSRYLDNAGKEVLSSVMAVAAFKGAVLSVPGLPEKSREKLAGKIKDLEGEVLRLQKLVNTLRAATNAECTKDSGTTEAWPVTFEELWAAARGVSGKQEEVWCTLVEGMKRVA